jgi:hypothetical protein
MGVDAFEKDWGDFKPTTKDPEGIKRIKEVCSPGTLM